MCEISFFAIFLVVHSKPTYGGAPCTHSTMKLRSSSNNCNLLGWNVIPYIYHSMHIHLGKLLVVLLIQKTFHLFRLLICVLNITLLNQFHKLHMYGLCFQQCLFVGIDLSRGLSLQWPPFEAQDHCNMNKMQYL